MDGVVELGGGYTSLVSEAKGKENLTTYRTSIEADLITNYRKKWGNNKGCMKIGRLGKGVTQLQLMRL